MHLFLLVPHIDPNGAFVEDFHLLNCEFASMKAVSNVCRLKMQTISKTREIFVIHMALLDTYAYSQAL